MKKKPNKKARKRSEFRFHKVEVANKGGKSINIEHPTFIFVEKDNKYVYIQITHSDHVEGLILIKLRKNPNPKDSRDSYRIDEIKIDTKDNFGKKKKGWEMDLLDENDIREKYKKDDSAHRT